MIKFDSYLNFFYSAYINDENYISGFGTRVLGDARDSESIERYFTDRRIAHESIVIPKQIHKTNISFIEETFPTTYVGESDGLITKRNKQILIVKTADCVPIMFVDKQSNIIGISHQGWKGTLYNMTETMLEAMIHHGARKENLAISIGPSIGACCYDIPEERVQVLTKKHPKIIDKILDRRNTKTYLNLLLANYLLLLAAGIRHKQIDFFPFCTQCDASRFFSRRRDGTAYQNMFSFIMRR